MVIQSYTRVLKIRPTVHQVPWKRDEPIRLARPVPVIALVYLAVLEVAFVVWSRIPVLGMVCHLPAKQWWFIPIYITYFAMLGSFDGRDAHVWLRAWLAWRLRPSRTRAGVRTPVSAVRGRRRLRWYAGPEYPRMSRARITGPATVKFNVPVRFALGAARKAWVVRHGTVPYVEPYDVGGRLEVKP